nr:hypothetical protein [uncultured Pedobacter sp.]
MKTIEIQKAIILPQVDPTDIINEFSVNLHKYSWSDLFSALEQEITPIMRIIIRAAISAKDKKQVFQLTIDKAEKRLLQINNTRRKNFVRRTYKKWGLFSMLEILKVYPGYESDMLFKDLEVKFKKKKRKKIKPRFDFRAMQLIKCEQLFHSVDKASKEFNKVCERIAALTRADIKRKPLNLTVKLADKNTYLFCFKWSTDESKIKAFHAKANITGITHDELVEFRRVSNF